MKNNVLVIDDSALILNALEDEIELLGYNCITATSYKDCADKLLEYKGKFDVALCDLGLPDAPKGEVVGLVTKFNIPAIVFTGSELEDDENKFRDMNIVDYVIKEGRFSIDYAVSLVRRIIENYKTDVIIVDDSKFFLSKFDDLLKRYKLNTHIAKNGVEALEILQNNQNVKLVLTDYVMPEMDGLELTKKIRKNYPKDELAIIVTSGNTNDKTASKFLKYGANDFLYKNFTDEEFYTRLNSNLEIIELFQNVKDKANKDYLTGMFNRRYLFDNGEEIYERIKNRKEESLFVAIIDIDKFKNINDTYGHDIGDIAIKEIPKILNKYVGSNSLIARLGGEEFCILVKGRTEQETKDLFEQIRDAFEKNIIITEKCELKYTISTGVCMVFESSLTKMITKADEALYEAKETGRNKVVFYEG